MAKILVVDDVEDIVVTMSHLFETFGHELRTGGNGRQALEIASSFAPEIVFMDLDMPVMNGFEAARLIRSDWPFQTCLVAITAAANDGIVAATRGAGFDLCLRKPAGTGALLTLIDTVARARA